MENIRNQDNIGETELLVASFGTSFPQSREADIASIEADLEQAFPDMSIRRGFTSGMIVNHVKKSEGLAIDTIFEALERAKNNGVKNLLVQTTHLMTGREYDKVVAAVESVKDNFEKVVVGDPLLAEFPDFKRVAQAIKNSLAVYDDGDTAFVLMGHGTDVAANGIYRIMQQTFRDMGEKNFYVGTVEAEPDVWDILAMVKKGNYTRIVMQAMMVVAGDHACNDMAGEEDSSWRSIFERNGYEVECVLKGLGENAEIRKIYVEHAKEAFGKMGKL